MINPPGIKLDNFTDLIFRFSGLHAHTADWPPHMWVDQYQYIVFAKEYQKTYCEQL